MKRELNFWVLGGDLRQACLARLLAEEAARVLEVPALPLLSKTRDTPPQSGLEEAGQRRANVLGVYRAPDAAAGLRVLLADDVVTTGSTLSECARVLKTAGAAGVVCVSGLGELVKQTRSACLESLGEDYILTARAKGLGERAVMVRHAFRGALTPVLTTVLGHIPHIIGGSVVVEQVFGWPGMGSLLFWGIENRDYPVVMGVTVVIALAVLLTNLLLDLAYGLADPRVRYGRG